MMPYSGATVDTKWSDPTWCPRPIGSFPVRRANDDLATPECDVPRRLSLPIFPHRRHTEC
jgi:hypothetical protein